MQEATQIIVKNHDPLVLVNSMNLYYKERKPECSLYSQDNFEIQVHEELLYQTPYLRDMIKSVHMDYNCCKIDIVCSSLSKSEVKAVVQFLYTGEISCADEKMASQMTKNLSELFGFSEMNFILEPRMNQTRPEIPHELKDIFKEDIKIEMLDPENDNVSQFFHV